MGIVLALTEGNSEDMRLFPVRFDGHEGSLRRS